MHSPPEINIDPARLHPRPVTAKILGVDVRAVDALIESGKLRSVEIGARKLTSGAAIIELLTGVAK